MTQGGVLTTRTPQGIWLTPAGVALLEHGLARRGYANGVTRRSVRRCTLWNACSVAGRPSGRGPVPRRREHA